jgi:hypothetical protein
MVQRAFLLTQPVSCPAAPLSLTTMPMQQVGAEALTYCLLPGGPGSVDRASLFVCGFRQPAGCSMHAAGGTNCSALCSAVTETAAACAAEYFFAVRGKTRVFVYVNGNLVSSFLTLRCSMAPLAEAVPRRFICSLAPPVSQGLLLIPPCRSSTPSRPALIRTAPTSRPRASESHTRRHAT